MRHSDLISPGSLPNAVALKREVLRALTGIQIVGMRVEGGVHGARTLAEFLRNAADIAERSAPAKEPAAPAPRAKK